jgi:DNA-binding CsgD family transcriptional regulator
MLNDNSFLLDKINALIKKHANASKPGSKRFNAHFSRKKNVELFKKLEQRIEALEDQNDQLIFFIHFLYENFPDLVKNMLPNNLNGNDRQLNGLQNSTVNEITRAHLQNQPALTKREIEILNLLVKGLCAKEIATILFISETTVITHKKNLKEKFCAKNSVELVSKAFNILLNSNKTVFQFNT